LRTSAVLHRRVRSSSLRSVFGTRRRCGPASLSSHAPRRPTLCVRS
jgi:hypothetical protein